MTSKGKPWLSPGIHTSFAIPQKNCVHLIPASSIQPVSIKWLWPGWVAQGKLQIIGGPPSTGKTTIATYFAATISRGGPGGACWPDKSPAPFGKVIYWSSKDGIADTIVPRLIAAGADMNHIHVIGGTTENGRSRKFNFATDIEKLGDAIATLGNVALIIIDSIVQTVPGDSNKNADVRRALETLVEMGERHNCAILGITHVNKSSKGKEPLDRLNGSLAYGAVARVVMLTAKVQADTSNESSSSCILVRAKSKIGADEGGFEYQIRSYEFQVHSEIILSSAIYWNEIPLSGPPKDILKFAETGGATEKTGAVEEAMHFLQSILANGGSSVPDIQAKAEEAGIAWSSVKRAKAALCIRSKKQCGVGQASSFDWFLPMASGDQSPPNWGDHSGPATMPNPTFQFATLGQHHQEGMVKSLFNLGANTHAPHAPLDPPDPLDPLDPLDPVVRNIKNSCDEVVLKSCMDACRQRLMNRINTATDIEGDEVAQLDEIIDHVINETLYCDPKADMYREALKRTTWWSEAA